MEYSNISGVGNMTLDAIIFDLNGTLSVRGMIVDGAKERIEKLQKMGFMMYLLSGNQRKNALELSSYLGLRFFEASSLEEKANFVKNLPTKNIVAIGNARIDIGMFQNAKLSIGTIQGEGIHRDILQHVDILVNNINDALDLLIDEDTLKATLKQ
jgi:soluble P-type ATPase